MNDYDLMVLIPWGIFGIAFIFVCVWLQISSRQSQRDQAPPARRGAGASAEPADGHDAALPGQERVPGCNQDGRRPRAGAAPLDHGEHPTAAPARSRGREDPRRALPGAGSAGPANTSRVMAVVAVSAPGRPNRRPASRG